MKSLADQLLAKGMVPSDQVQELRAKEVEHNRLEERKGAGMAIQRGRPADKELARDDATIESLYACQTVDGFCDLAKRVLQDRPDHIGRVITEAHRLKDAPGGKDLVWRVYRVRDLLGKCPSDKREQFLHRAFRRHNPKVSIPE